MKRLCRHRLHAAFCRGDLLANLPGNWRKQADDRSENTTNHSARSQLPDPPRLRCDCGECREPGSLHNIHGQPFTGNSFRVALGEFALLPSTYDADFTALALKTAAEHCILGRLL